MLDITSIVSTKGRYFTTLPLAVLSVAHQTWRPKRLIIFDDNENREDLRSSILWQNIFATLSVKGIEWEVVFGEGKGQVLNHQKSLDAVKTPLIHRFDDDNYLESDVLERLVMEMDEDTAAVGGLVLDPKMEKHSKLASNKIEDIYLGLNEQWFEPTKWIRDEHTSGYGLNRSFEVDHLYSTFVYKREVAKEIGGYCLDLSPVGHREETILTYSMKCAGYKLKIQPTAITWHYRSPTGGIRSDDNKWMFEHDEKIFAKKLQDWGVIPNQIKLIVLEGGLGDHLAFLNVLPEIKAKYKNIVIANCFNEVFADEKDITLISIAEASMLCDYREHNIYKKMWDWGWKTSMVDAYRRLYL